MTRTTIAIASGKGGTGKTFISTNLFNSLQNSGLNMALVDCDAEAPNDREFLREGVLQSTQAVTQKIPVIDKSKCTYCGKCDEYCNFNAIFFLEEPQTIEVLEELCHGCGACSVACEYGAITEKDDLLGKINRYKFPNGNELIEGKMEVGVHVSIQIIKESIKAAENFDLVLLDSPPGTGCPFIQTVYKADYVVLVTEPTPFGLSDLKQSVEILREMDIPCGVIINRADLGTDEALNYLKQENIPLLMSVPFDREIAVAYSKGEMITNLSSEWREKFSQLYRCIKEDFQKVKTK
ncbi:MAG: 2-ketoisovalerate ferredoxin oxidoreductase subunit delta [Bacteroidetes bacterium ADurb.BinA174]|nr:MAG: 2-ketoisovalerate ferredoxin oxidoreductase subunit delta [Bacteroidetes bacterium ADurb.BinA174]